MMIPSKQIAASSATMPSKLDPHILKSKAITMQRIGLCVANGNDHLFAVQGEVELTNALRFARKMDERYEMTASASTRSHRKAAGRAQVSLFCCRASKTDHPCALKIDQGRTLTFGASAGWECNARA